MVYSILDKVPPGKVYVKVVQSETTEKVPMQLNDALTKLQSEQQLLDKKMPVKSKSVGTASTLSGASESSESFGELGFSFDIQAAIHLIPTSSRTLCVSLVHEDHT